MTGWHRYGSKVSLKLFWRPIQTVTWKTVLELSREKWRIDFNTTNAIGQMEENNNTHLHQISRKFSSRQRSWFFAPGWGRQSCKLKEWKYCKISQTWFESQNARQTARLSSYLCVVKKNKNTFDKFDLRLLQLCFSKLCVENRQGKAHIIKKWSIRKSAKRPLKHIQLPVDCVIWKVGFEL